MELDKTQQLLHRRTSASLILRLNMNVSDVLVHLLIETQANYLLTIRLPRCNLFFLAYTFLNSNGELVLFWF